MCQYFIEIISKAQDFYVDNTLIEAKWHIVTIWFLLKLIKFKTSMIPAEKKLISWFQILAMFLRNINVI